MKLFFGHSRHQIDAKNRIRIPPKFSEKLGTTFYMARGTGNCIYCFNEETMEKYTQEFESAPAYEEDKKLSLLRHFFNSVEEVEEDGQGRVLIPKELVDYARLEKDIVISGSGDRLEIWNAQIYDEIVGKKSFDQVLSDVRN